MDMNSGNLAAWELSIGERRKPEIQGNGEELWRRLASCRESPTNAEKDIESYGSLRA